MTPAQLLSLSAVRYQQAVNNMLEFWVIGGQCKNCSHQSDIKQLIKQQMVMVKEVKALVKN
jgi:hypothetical protein